MSELPTHTGGCHCGNVRFRVRTDLAQVGACNCSICSKTGTLLSFVPASEFELLSEPSPPLTDYQFNKHVIHHYFCPVCGVRSFATGTAPDGSDMRAVNVRCLDDVDVDSLKVVHYDGRSL